MQVFQSKVLAFSIDYIYTYDDSEIDMSESLNDLGANDGYHGSDTEDEIPDPNLSPIALYQETNIPPKPLEKRRYHLCSNFENGQRC